LKLAMIYPHMMRIEPHRFFSLELT
jgi:hypothetical protein